MSIIICGGASLQGDHATDIVDQVLQFNFRSSARYADGAQQTTSEGCLLHSKHELDPRTFLYLLRFALPCAFNSG
jgi:hypothetical protein